MNTIEVRDDEVIVEIAGEFIAQPIIRDTSPKTFWTKDAELPSVTVQPGYSGQPQRVTRTPNKHGGVDVKVEDISEKPETK